MLSYSLYWNIAYVYFVWLHCRDVPSLILLLSPKLLYYIAELFPIINIADVYVVLKHCSAIPNPKTLLTYTLTYYTAEMFLVL